MTGIYHTYPGTNTQSNITAIFSIRHDDRKDKAFAVDFIEVVAVESGKRSDASLPVLKGHGSVISPPTMAETVPMAQRNGQFTACPVPYSKAGMINRKSRIAPIILWAYPMELIFFTVQQLSRKKGVSIFMVQRFCCQVSSSF